MLRTSVKTVAAKKAQGPQKRNWTSVAVKQDLSRKPSYYYREVPAEKYFDKILVANRGEIACRVIKTAKRLGIKTVAVHSDVDAHAKFVQLADEAVLIGPAPTRDSYLRMERIIEAAKKTGAQAIHPGYGFLSENGDFIAMCEKENIKFIGPSSYSVHAMGDKIESKKFAKAAGVNTIPGFLGEVDGDDMILKISNEIGYPVMMKPSAGGGGKGMRIAWNDKEALEGFKISKREAKSSFGDDRMLIEKYIDNPRHVEIQVLGDTHGNVLYLPERECSIQRRNQKVIEEAPSTAIDAATRKAMGEQAASLAKAVKYHSAGTVEMLVDSKRNFYFLEMNTRLQVEHPVTEFITGIDLVEQMIRVAAGKPLSFTQDQIDFKGWATEARVYAEDPYRNFLPSIGILTSYKEPYSPKDDIRADSGILEGSEISIYYDPLICKLVTYGETRQDSINKMKYALDTYLIRGVNHNISFLRSVLENKRYLEGRISTKYIPEEFPKGFTGHKLNTEQRSRLISSAAVIELLRAMRPYTAGGNQVEPFFNRKYIITIQKKDLMETADGEGEMDLEVEVASSPETDAEGNPEFLVSVNGAEPIKVGTSWPVDHHTFIANVGGNQCILQIMKFHTHGYTLQYLGTQYEVKVMTPREKELSKYMPVGSKIDHAKMICSPMPGNVVIVSVKKGDKVVIGQELCVVEAMKMQNVIRSERDGVIAEVPVKVGDNVAADDILIRFE